MDEKLKQALQRVREELVELRRQAESEEGGFLLDCDLNPEMKSVVIEGDTAGLLHFASRLVYLAAKDVPGAHEHFDTTDENGEDAPDQVVVYKWSPQ